MDTGHMSTLLLRGLCWFLGIIFLMTGVLNLFLVHPVPGVFYLLLAILYSPPTDRLLKRAIGFSIPLWLKVVGGFVVLWGTLAVGDLAEILGL